MVEVCAVAHQPTCTPPLPSSPPGTLRYVFDFNNLLTLAVIALQAHGSGYTKHWQNLGLYVLC